MSILGCIPRKQTHWKSLILVKYLPCGKYEIIRFANCEIFCCAESEMK